jgi:phage terminase large subunit
MQVQPPEAYLPLWTGCTADIAAIEHYAFWGGRGGAKSHSIGEAVAALSCQRTERVVCGRQFQNSINDSVKELIEQKIKALNMAVYFHVTEREIKNTATGSRFSFIGMDRNPESAKSLEGATLFWGEEAQTFTKRSVELIIPTIRAPGSRMIWSWNPRLRTDEVDKLFRGPVPPEAAYIREVSWRDNPHFFRTRMPSEFRRSLKASPKRHLHIWEGGYDENPDAGIFESWSVGRPAFIPEKCRPRFGMDFGFGSDPNVLVKVYIIEPQDLGYDPETHLGFIYVAQESVGYKVPNKQLPDFMRKITEVNDYYVTADSARPETIDYLQSKGFSIYGAKKGAGSVKNGINWLQGYHILIDPDCPIAAEEIKQYKWKMDPNDRPLPMPADKQQDHCIDAIRYAVEEESISETGDGDGVDYV